MLKIPSNTSAEEKEEPVVGLSAFRYWSCCSSDRKLKYGEYLNATGKALKGKTELDNLLQNILTVF